MGIERAALGQRSFFAPEKSLEAGERRREVGIFSEEHIFERPERLDASPDRVFAPLRAR